MLNSQAIPNVPKMMIKAINDHLYRMLIDTWPRMNEEEQERILAIVFDARHRLEGGDE